jgi:hypothetical protein
MVTCYSVSRKLTGFLFSIVVAAALVRLAIVLNLPIRFLPGAGHDDGLFMRLAASLASGQWLGEFSQFTLMKGPGYPVFLAITSFTGLPVSASHALLQFAAILVTAWAVYALTTSRAMAGLSFVILTFYPIGFMPELLRVIRDQIYWAQTLLVFSLFAIVLLAPPRRRLVAMLVAGLAGLILGWAWLTREEGIWFIPGLGLLVVGAIPIHRRERGELLALARNIAMAAVVFFAVNVAFMTGNRLAYGWFVGVDFKEHNFQSTLEALEDVDAGPVIPYVPVPNAARSEIAKVSPAFAPLSEALAPGQPIFETWNRIGCNAGSKTCGEIVGALFMWALRDAAAASKFYQSPAAAAENFGKVANEIAAACADGRLHCHRRWVSFMPRLAAEQRASIPGAVLAVIDQILFLTPPAPTVTAPFMASREEQYYAFLNNPNVVSAPGRSSYDLTVRGWYRDAESPEWPAFKIYDEQDLEISSSIRRLPSPDLQQHFSDPSAENNRYEMSFRCPNTCAVVALTSHGKEMHITVDTDRSGAVFSDSAVLYIDSVSSASATGFVNPAQRVAANIRIWLVRFYKILIPLLLVAGFFATAAAIWRAVRERAVDAVLLTALAAWTLVATRIVILALIEASSFNAANILYTAPATYLAVVAAFLSIAAIRRRKINFDDHE